LLLSEVARKGRRFRRTSVPENWYYLSGLNIMVENGVGKCIVHFNAEELTALDWESEPARMEITAKDLLDVAKTLSDHPITNQRRLAPIEFMKLVIVRLGLEEM